MESLNQHLPTQRRRLSELLEMAEPQVEGRGGVAYHLDAEELREIAGWLTEGQRALLRLPILLIAETAAEQSAWRVSGRLESLVVANAIGRPPPDGDELRLYAPHLAELRRRLPTTTTALYLP